MDAVILAAGKGTRLRPITNTTPKPLIQIGQVSILEHTLTVLPEAITRVIIVVGHLGEQIENFIQSRDFPFEVVVVRQNQTMQGTMGAVLSAEQYVQSERFLVLSGDDWYEKEDIEILLKEEHSLAVAPQSLRGYHKILCNEEGYFTGFGKPSENESQWPIATGAYVVPRDIFSIEPARIADGEYGLPQTMITLHEKIPIRVVRFTHWYPMNSFEDLEILKKKVVIQ